MDFDDALSEDWPSQPGSSRPSSARGERLSSDASGGSKMANLTHRRTSNAGTSDLFGPRRRGSDKPHRVLSEKRASQLNSRTPITSIRPRKVSTDVSLTSTNSGYSVRHGTVLQSDKMIPQTAHDRGTPEWKRRLLNQNPGSRDSKDLFAPIDLEDVFNDTKNQQSILATKPSNAHMAKSSLPHAVTGTTNNFPSQSVTQGISQQQPGNVQNSYPRKDGARKVSLSNIVTGIRSDDMRAKPAAPIPLPKDQSPVLKAGFDTTARENVFKATDDLRSLIDSHASPMDEPEGASQSGDSLERKQQFVTLARGSDYSDINTLERHLDTSSRDIPEAFQIEPNADTEVSIQRPETPKIGASPSKPSGSPLKLFGKYDTYTNDRLARRVVQLEDIGPQSIGIMNTTDRESEIISTTNNKLINRLRFVKLRAVSNFGVGELDQYAFDHEENPDMQFGSTAPRSFPSRSTSYSHPTLRMRAHDEAGENLYQSQDSMNDEGKRELNSPEKVSMAKRRRTSLPLTNFGNGGYEDFIEKLPGSELLVAGRKRKDARYDQHYPKASPEVIASRHILQPRISYGPSQRTVSTKASDAAISVDSVDKTRAIVISADSVAEWNNLGVKADTAAVIGVRKKSVTTADFFKEANLIMQNIRAQAHSPISYPRDFTEEASPDASVMYNEEFTMEQLSRPASREGSCNRRPAHERIPNARVVSHLRKFEETDEGELDLTSSIASIPKVDENLANLTDDLQSDPPNIRIRDRIVSDTHHKQHPVSSGEQYKSHSSSEGATDRSLQTGSSAASSVPKATISPEKVSHLLSRTMGGMTFDETRGCWVKTRLTGGEKTCYVALTDGGRREDYEDDPFGAIPDLTIDESQEILAVRGIIRRSSSNKEEAGTCVPKDTSSDLKHQAHADEASSIISKYTRFASSGPVVETRATSWGDTGFRQSRSEKTEINALQSAAYTQHASEEPRSREQLSDIAASVSPSSTPTKEPSFWASASPAAKSDHEIDYAEVPRSPLLLADHRTRKIEHDEVVELQYEPLDPEESRLVRFGSTEALQAAVATPERGVRQENSLLVPASMGHWSVADLQLTPLPDFTMNQPDESLQLDVGYVAQRRGIRSREAVEGTFSLAIRDLVKKITDVESHEPYWEFLRKLDLRKQNLLTLHMLSEFCSRIEDLDISENQLGQLNGVPKSLRVLNARNNNLSSLTAWTHLPNLQYLNVSGNGITNLRAFTSLIHLREFNAESNELVEIEEILNMDNLITVKLGHNRIKKLDFRKAQLPLLTSLDLHSNEVHSVLGLSQLSVLQDLNLRDNQLECFLFDEEDLPRSLQHLDLSMNHLSDLDLSEAPCLKSLAVDRNKVSNLEGLEMVRTIETVSWSHQTVNKTEGHPIIEFSCCSQAQFLNLSGNLLNTFVPKLVFLNLRRLELASCGLEVLGKDFGSFMPNLRVINLNDNGLKDIRPLLGVMMLEELHIARNRISRLRRTMTVLKHFAPHLHALDMRENPLTLGFYPQIRADRLSFPDAHQDRDSSLDQLCRDCDKSCSTAYLNMTPTDEGNDYDYQGRLDEETLMRRRVYEGMIMCSCSALESWDGMAMERRRFFGTETWARLVELGILKKKTANNARIVQVRKPFDF